MPARPHGSVEAASRRAGGERRQRDNARSSVACRHNLSPHLPALTLVPAGKAQPASEAPLATSCRVVTNRAPWRRS
eukprot:2328102-Prymnesium_polylepis.1